MPDGVVISSITPHTVGRKPSQHRNGTKQMITKLLAGIGSVALLSGCFFPPDYDKLDGRADPDIEMPKALAHNEQTYLDIAYHLLSESKKRPGAHSFYGEFRRGQGTWWVRGKEKERVHSEFQTILYPVFSIGFGAEGGVRAIWLHSHPKVVFFAHTNQFRHGPEDAITRYCRDSKGHRKCSEMVLISYHPGQPPPTRFSIGCPMDDKARQRWNEALKADPLALSEPCDWQPVPLKPNWSWHYLR